MIFTLFVTIIAVVSFNKERKLKREIIKSDQVVYANVTSTYITQNQIDIKVPSELSNLLTLFPKELRLSILNEEGYIVFDNLLSVEEIKIRGNRTDKPEIKKALLYGEGWNIRKSLDGSDNFIYYAVYKENYIVRIGFPHTPTVRSFLDTEYGFLIFVILVALLAFVFLSLIYWDSRKSVKNIKKYISTFRCEKKSQKKTSFKDEEINEIQAMMLNLCDQFEATKKDTSFEREKLLEHFHYAEEGISFFKPNYENIYTNAHFIQYLNILLNEPTFNVNNLFESHVFSEVVRFLGNPGDKNTFNGKLYGHGNHYSVCVIIFDDKSFEIIIRDISETEKNSFNRAEMTNNIAHELKTPVTSIRGYLETIIDYKNLTPEKRDDFIQRAYKQVIRLSEIIHDVILLSKTADAPQSFAMEDINICEMLQEIYTDSKKSIEQNKCTIDIKVDPKITVKGNRTLLYSIFRNLGSNALKYAGENITITIYNYMQDDHYYYFSFADNGKGIDETYLNHIFERFYRITEGRTRDTGGFGLGLAIVKDAVAFHKGEIHAKNRAGGGLEFLFTIRKK